jgi:hypothetical protein
MRLLKLLTLFIGLWPFAVFAQSGVISGKVARLDTKTPLSKVSIFLSNSSYGTVSADDGTFTLSGIKPGQYDLIATSVGFEDFNQTVLVGKDPIKVNIELLQKITELREVVISTSADWKKNYAMFEKEFIGVSPNAKKCRVDNPHTMNLVYHSTKQTLNAWSDDFLVVENRALGYRVKLLIKDFAMNKLESLTSWEAQLLFEQLHGTEEQIKEWKKKREECYYGSPRHFFKSLSTGKMDEEGFVVYKLNRVLNPERPQVDVIDRKMKYFRKINRADSFNYWLRLYKMPRYIDNLNKIPYTTSQLLVRTHQPDVFAITFPNYLYVVYTKKREEFDFKDVYHPLDMPNYETSVVTLFKENYAAFDLNGNIISTPPPLFEGTWSKSKIAELLPLDYAPGD